MSRIYEHVPLDVELPKEPTLEGFYADWEGVRVLIKDINKNASTGMLRIHFGCSVFAYRVIDEGDHLLTAYSNVGLIAIVKNSEYLEWFHRESCGVRKGQNLKHYAIHTTNECIDIIDSKLPKIEWL